MNNLNAQSQRGFERLSHQEDEALEHMREVHREVVRVRVERLRALLPDSPEARDKALANVQLDTRAGLAEATQLTRTLDAQLTRRREDIDALFHTLGDNPLAADTLAQSALERSLLLAAHHRSDADHLAQLQGVVRRHILGATSTEAFERELTRAASSHTSALDLHANRAVMGYSRALIDERAAQLGYDTFEYFGPVDARTRPFCRKHAGHRYTREHISALDNKQGSDAFVHGGGWRCRHHWRPVRAEWESTGILGSLHSEDNGSPPEQAAPRGADLAGGAGATPEWLTNAEVLRQPLRERFAGRQRVRTWRLPKLTDELVRDTVDETRDFYRGLFGEVDSTSQNITVPVAAAAGRVLLEELERTGYSKLGPVTWLEHDTGFFETTRNSSRLSPVPVHLREQLRGAAARSAKLAGQPIWGPSSINPLVRLNELSDRIWGDRHHGVILAGLESITGDERVLAGALYSRSLLRILVERQLLEPTNSEIIGLLNLELEHTPGINLGGDALSVVWHEMAHHFERMNPRLFDAAARFRRVQEQRAEIIDDTTKTRQAFSNLYAVRRYPDNKFQTEVFTTGFERFADPSDVIMFLEEDDGHFAFILSSLEGRWGWSRETWKVYANHNNLYKKR